MKHVIVIAEAGVNHNGSLEIAKKLIDRAAEAKVDFVKFQTFKTENLVTQSAAKADYQKVGCEEEESQFDMLKKLELTARMHCELIEYCEKKKIRFLSTPFDITSADYLENKVSLYKIPSGELTNIPLITHIAKKKKPLIISTGMATLEEVELAINAVKEVWRSVGFEYSETYNISGVEVPGLVVLHCTTAYPTPYDQVNLLAMNTIRSELKVKVGYSDHTLGIEVPVAAVALGACVIEKHFTLDRLMDGPDHSASLEPEELVSMVKSIRNISLSLGDGVKQPSEVEAANKDVARKSLHFSKNLKKNQIVTRLDLSIKRPGNGLPPSVAENLIGRKLLVNVNKDDLVSLSHFV